MITYVSGDATVPVVSGNRIVAHVCNDVGAWGRGFVLSVSRRWPEVERMYRRWYQEQERLLHHERLELGKVQFVPVSYDGSPPTWTRTFVANMIAQRGIRSTNGVPPIRYDALEVCLLSVAACAQSLGSTSVHMPRIGCGLAGGAWSSVEPIVSRALKDVPTYVYDFASKDSRTAPWSP